MDHKPEITQSLQYPLPKFKLFIVDTTFSFIYLKTLLLSLELNISLSLFKYSFNILSFVFYQVTQISSVFLSKVKRIQFVYLLTSFKMETFFSINELSEKYTSPYSAISLYLIFTIHLSPYLIYISSSLHNIFLYFIVKIK